MKTLKSTLNLFLLMIVFSSCNSGEISKVENLNKTPNLESEPRKTEELKTEISEPKELSYADYQIIRNVSIYEKEQRHIPLKKAIKKVFEDKYSDFRIWDKKEHFLLIELQYFIAVFDIKNPNEPQFVWGDSLDYKDGNTQNCRFIDFSKDENTDIICCYGDEGYFNTDIFIQELDKEERFKKVDFKDNNSFATILDLDADGKPELLINKNGNIEGNISFSNYEKELEEVYLNISGKFHSSNPQYIRRYPSAMLYMGHGIEILQFENGDFVNKTTSFSEHIKWRLDFLKKNKTNLTEHKKGSIELLRKQLRSI